MLVVIVTLMIDSEIGYIADFIPEQLSSRVGIFAVEQYFILTYVKQSNKENRVRALYFEVIHSIVNVIQCIQAGIFAFVILQIIIAQQYNIGILYVSYPINYGLWIEILGLLARAFSFWYRLSNKNAMVIILALSMIAFVVNGVTSLSTYFVMLTQQKLVITSTDVARFLEFSIGSLGSQIGLASQIASSVAYLLTWIGTVKLLYPHIKKLGKIKFWTIMCAAMVYYLITFPVFVLGYFTPSESVDAR
jgi:hypothetical protein